MTWYSYIRVRVRERLSATPGHVIGQGPAPGGGVVPCGGGGGECTFLRYYGLFLKQNHSGALKGEFLGNNSAGALFFFMRLTLWPPKIKKKHSGALKGEFWGKHSACGALFFYASHPLAPIGPKKGHLFIKNIPFCHSGALKGEFWGKNSAGALFFFMRLTLWPP